MASDVIAGEKVEPPSHRTDGTLAAHYEKFRDCVHCGLCLPACPTYAELGLEMDSPRGRIYLMRAYAEGRIGLTDNLVNHVYQCLDCRACETACPAGVSYGSIVELARSEIEEKRPRPLLERCFRNLVFNRLLPSRSMLALTFIPVRLYQILGVQRIMRLTGITRWLPERLRTMETMLPPLPAARLKKSIKRLIAAQGQRRYRVGLVTGCVMNEMFTDVNVATVNVLTRNGCDVVVPDDQTCCGALQVHSGERATAADLARRNIDAFSDQNLDAVIINAAGCGAHLKEYGDLLADDPVYSERASRFASEVKDISEFLSEIPLEAPQGHVQARVAYHDACHLAHGQQVRSQPREILRMIPGIELLELAESDWCCGSAGIYNITHPEMADRLLKRKVGNVNDVTPQIVATGNPGCMLQIRHGIEKYNTDLSIEVVHPIQLLDRAYQRESSSQRGVM